MGYIYIRFIEVTRKRVYLCVNIYAAIVTITKNIVMIIWSLNNLSICFKTFIF